MCHYTRVHLPVDIQNPLFSSVQDHVGSGHFALVHRGIWRTPQGERKVAVKELKKGANEEDRVKFLQEAMIMGQFNHTNVVKLYGVVTIHEPVSPSLVAQFVKCESGKHFYFMWILSPLVMIAFLWTCVYMGSDGLLFVMFVMYVVYVVRCVCCLFVMLFVVCTCGCIYIHVCRCTCMCIFVSAPAADDSDGVNA